MNQRLLADRRVARTRGFTLVELIAVLVIVAVVGAIAAPMYVNLRYQARVNALETVRVKITTTMANAQARYLTQNGGSTVTLNGASIEVFQAGNPQNAPAGLPTPAGMFVALGCGDSAPVLPASVPCPGLPGYSVRVFTGSLGVWPTSVATVYADTWCWIDYWPQDLLLSTAAGPDGPYGYFHYGIYVGTNPDGVVGRGC